MNPEKLKLYALVNPSDQITFAAPSHQVAFLCALVLGNGKTPATCEDGTDIPATLLFLSEEQGDAKMTANLGCNIGDFIEAHGPEIIACLRSFRYGSFADWREIESCLECLPSDPAKQAFLDKHEDRRRTSMSRWVKAAWDMADGMHRKLTEKDTEKEAA